jgi:hypothetical protein
MIMRQNDFLDLLAAERLRARGYVTVEDAPKHKA